MTRWQRRAPTPTTRKLRTGSSPLACRRPVGCLLCPISSVVKRSASSAVAEQLPTKGVSMKKAKSTSNELRTEYKRSDFNKLERGKYYKRVRASSNVVVLDPEVAA